MINPEDLNSPLPAPIITTPLVTVPNVPINPPILTLNHRPTILSILIVLLAGDFLYRTIITIMTTAGILLIFSVVPVLCIFPIVFAATTTFFIYIFLKTKDLSLGSYKLLLTTSIVVPLLYSLLMYLMLSQAQTAVSLVTGSGNANPLGIIFSAVLNEVNLLFLITFLVVKKKKDLFTNDPSDLNLLKKIVLTILGLIILIPAISVTYIVVYSSFHPGF